MLCSHSYYRVDRTVKENSQLFKKKKEFIKMYVDRIITASEQFDIDDVHDISYKNISGEKGFLYLHTSSGMYSYVTESKPNQFMKIYKELKTRL